MCICGVKFMCQARAVINVVWWHSVSPSLFFRHSSVDPPLCLRSVFVPAPFLLRFKSLSRMGLTWDLLRTYLGLASDASKQFTSPNPFLDAKLRNLELAVRSSHTFRYDSIRFSWFFYSNAKTLSRRDLFSTTENKNHRYSGY